MSDKKMKYLLQQKRMNQMLISTLEGLQKEAKEAKGFFYPNCTPDTPEGRASFVCYKEARRALKQISRDLKQLRECQKWVKFMIGHELKVQTIIREMGQLTFDFSDENED